MMRQTRTALPVKIQIPAQEGMMAVVPLVTIFVMHGKILDTANLGITAAVVLMTKKWPILIPAVVQIIKIFV